MKKIFAIVAVASLIASCNSNRGWSASDRKKVIADCVKESKGGPLEDKAQGYCECMQPILEKKYPTVKEANKVTTADITNDPAMKSAAMKCLGLDNASNNGTNGSSTGTGWSDSQKQFFVKTCAAEFIKGTNNTQEQADHYCSCMADKLSASMSYEAANSMPDSTLNSPEWQKEILNCLPKQE